MKLPFLLLATVAAVSAQAEITTGILFCQARISMANDGDLSVALPATPGCVDANGNPATLWRIGNVVVGGATSSGKWQKNKRKDTRDR